MDCREFQRIHPDLLDDALTPLELVEAHRHLLECEKCSSQDVAIRRALLVFRNLQPIQPSAQFSDRLNRKLASSSRTDERSFSSWRLPLLGAVAAASLAMGIVVTERMKTRTTLSMAPVVAAAPVTQTSPLLTPTIAASMSAGFPVWPAFLMAEHASQQLSDAEFRFTSYRR